MAAQQPIRTRRASDMQSSQRRPSFTRPSQQYDAYMTNGRRRPSFPRSERSTDFGMDNFSYNPEYLASSEVPEKLLKNLPLELKGEVHVWHLACAALETGLERITRLYGDAPKYAFPSKIASSNVLSSPVTPLIDADTQSPPLIAAALERLSLVPGSPRVYAVTQGMESPPLTPTVTNSSQALSICSDHDETHLRDDPAMEAINEFHDDPLPRFYDDDFNEISWETYMRRYTATFQDVREAKNRMNGHGRRIKTLSSELAHDANPAERQIAADLMSWWSPIDQTVAKELCNRVLRLKVPDVNALRTEMRASCHCPTADAKNGECI